MQVLFYATDDNWTAIDTNYEDLGLLFRWGRDLKFWPLDLGIVANGLQIWEGMILPEGESTGRIRQLMDHEWDKLKDGQRIV